MDILDNLIQTAQISGSINIQCQFQGQWFVEHQPQQNQGIVHIVIQGSGYVKIQQAPARLMQAGDILFFPRGRQHSFSHNAQAAPVVEPLRSYQSGAFEIKQSGGALPDLSLFCATFHYDAQAELIFNLPDVIFLHLEQAKLRPLLDLLTQESQHIESGASSVINALAAVLLVKMIRAYLQQDQQQLKGALNGWQDKRLRPLIQQIVNQPEADWSLDHMLAITPLSRAQLMRLFKQKTGSSPHAFVIAQRLQKAAMLLNRSADSILNIALNTGFQSETHFGKAFKKHYGVQPSLYRKQNMALKKSAEIP